MPLVECKQGEPDWLIARTGLVTASRMGDVMAKRVKGTGELKCRYDYKIEIVSELLTGRAVEHYVTPAMEFGIENEPLAVESYEAATGALVEETGFWVHPEIKYFGASPDRLLGEDGVLEVKCPTTAVHIEYMLADEVPEQYKPQLLAEMACTGRQWAEFVSFDPRLPKEMRLFMKRFQRDPDAIAAMEAEVVQFLSEVNELLAKLKGEQ